MFSAMRSGDGFERSSQGQARPALPVSGARGSTRTVFAACDCARLAARRGWRPGDEGGLRRGRLRRLYGRSGARESRAAELRRHERLHFVAGATRRGGTHHDRGSGRGRDAAPAATGDGRPSRLAMRVLHAGHRDEPFCSLPLRGAVDPPSLCDQLAGNLCRCTGYRPILAAALATCDGAPTDRFAATNEDRAAALAALADDADLCIGDEGQFFAAPASIEGLAALYERFPDATLVGGATDVGLWVTKQLRDLKRVIWLGRVAGLDAVADENGTLALGAGVTLAEAAPLLAAIHPDLGELLRRFGSVQVRVSGTVDGNIANGSPIGDLAPALIALGGRVVLRKSAARRTLPLEDFFIAYGKQDRAPGEFVLAIEAPRLEAKQHYRAFKVSKRFDEDISAVMMAARIDVDGRRVAGARIACGGMAATPKRAANAETAVVGASLDDRVSWRAALQELSNDFTPLTDQRASAAYRMTVAANLLEKALVEIGGADAPTRIR